MNVASVQVVQQSRWSDSHVYFTSRTSVPVDASMSESELQRRLVIHTFEPDMAMPPGPLK
jgi:hypothetical protein